ncbi:MAG TPA: DUF1203 domain-containing protein [Chitinophagaceae bacterium]|nr:DUF1203 domain-containing protein [Chitinophagaceae bacterium]
MNGIYVPISQDYADRIRSTRQDDFGHAVETHIAGETGYGPCRCCLKQFRPGEKRLLFSYAPVAADHPFNEVGPVFIHEDCQSYNERTRFPEEVKNGRLPISLLLRCYNKEKRVIAAVPIKDISTVEEQINRLLSDPQTAFIHIRNAIDQCFIAGVNRDQGTGS